MQKVTVKAKKCFYWGPFANEMKTPQSEPFEVTEWEYRQLSSKAMVDLVEDAAKKETQPKQESDKQPEQPSQPEAQAKKTRRTKNTETPK
ncbi:TPA: hypothetical protein NIK62_000164 [Vibrio cholerae]|uniref:hypothetical protein n=1 Tax=Vibrio cholerae TaxID=666 RepID=UPI00005F45FE|nr:hypothetical protein [Vibrio cholerae]EMC8696591.1 hypothetical protein [Vibrio cholerae]KFD96720.1 hypothetical protein DN33_150 [Vibrio cholerae]KNA58468.1 hypothetical protein VCV51_032682 [Vibrio cholerae V51]GIB64887.1 hypothetical protein VCSRO141_0663 [Vibrio cholerae]HCF7740819.1 hypothetical protein [Vibrio cholerae]